jgi:hypothetical protein
MTDEEKEAILAVFKPAFRRAWSSGHAPKEAYKEGWDAVEREFPDFLSLSSAAVTEVLINEIKSEEALSRRIASIAKRHRQERGENYRELVIRAAALGDKEAVEILPRVERDFLLYPREGVATRIRTRKAVED